MLNSGLIESFKIAPQPSNQLIADNQASVFEIPFTEPDLSVVDSKFVLDEISKVPETNYQSHYSSPEGQYSCNIQKALYQSNNHSLHSDQFKESNQVSNQMSNTENNSTALRKKLQERLNPKSSLLTPHPAHLPRTSL
ncbi:hypothetical protein BpHYR1_023780 [Brachionus plicatilis]|uniref:Uncharacterized protein n=1 Tax=Brachionus plicatilis TaxID=10195 RepID=A0A3M7QD88_BRAPC|nr:hypothetical protein BpHYR1_023780 [Brachionus plicatilis]